MSEMTGLFAVHISQPDYNDMETILANTVDKGICLIALERVAAQEALTRGRSLRGLVHAV